TATMSVYVDEKPEIHGATDLTIKVGDLFDPMQGITVSDKEDDATATPVKLEITGDVDTTKAGKYVVTYTATDSIGNNSTLAHEVTVVATNIEEPLLQRPEPGSGSTTTKLPNTGVNIAEQTILGGAVLSFLGFALSKISRRNRRR
ncbi:MAG: immunoglobulin-like domain-containing protein, partial [Culicoidibacterales bacterium]